MTTSAKSTNLLIDAVGKSSDALLAALRVARSLWNNTAFSASAEYLKAMAMYAASRPQGTAVFECGCGLTTAVLSELVNSDELIVVEDRQEWLRDTMMKMRRPLKGWKEIQHAPLVAHDGYDWYAMPEIRKPVSVIVCDGPYGGTRGGRYGAVPQLLPHCHSEFTILLDDANRQQERELIGRWAEFGIKPVTNMVDCMDGRQFAVMHCVRP